MRVGGGGFTSELLPGTLGPDGNWNIDMFPERTYDSRILGFQVANQTPRNSALLMDTILHQFIGSLSHDLEDFSSRWCSSSSTVNSTCIICRYIYIYTCI